MKGPAPVFLCHHRSEPTTLKECLETIYSEGWACRDCFMDCYRKGWPKKRVDRDNAKIVERTKKRMLAQRESKQEE